MLSFILAAGMCTFPGAEELSAEAPVYDEVASTGSSEDPALSYDEFTSLDDSGISVDEAAFPLSAEDSISADQEDFGSDLTGSEEFLSDELILPEEDGSDSVLFEESHASDLSADLLDDDLSDESDMMEDTPDASEPVEDIIELPAVQASLDNNVENIAGEDIAEDSLLSDDPDETGLGSITSPVAVSLGRQVNGTLTDTNTVDYYKVTLPSSGRLTLNATASIYRNYYYLYESTQTQRLWYEHYYWNEVTRQSNVSKSFDLTKGTYYFVVSRDGYNGSYNFTFTFQTAGETYTETGYGNDNSISAAHTVSFSKEYRAQLAKNDDKDFYRFTIATSGLVQIKVRANIYKMYVHLYNSDGQQMWYNHPYWNEASQEISTTYSFYLTSGTYYFSCSRDDYTGNYKTWVYFSSSNESFKESGNGTNNAISSANSVNLNQTYKGQLAFNDDRDFYSFNVTTTGEVTVNATAMLYRLYYIIYDSNGNEVWKYHAYWNEAVGKSTIAEKVTLSAGKYYFEVLKDGYEGNYTFSIAGKTAASTKLKAPVIKAVYNSVNGGDLYWNPVSGATGYIVYRFRAAEGTKKVTETNASTTHIYDTAIKNGCWGRVYHYYVVGVKNGTQGNWSKPAVLQRVAALSINTLTNSSSRAATAAWDVISGAENKAHGYQIQYAESTTDLFNRSGTFKYKTLSGRNSKSTVITGLTKGKTYYFRVRCYVNYTNSVTGAYTQTWSQYSTVRSLRISK